MGGGGLRLAGSGWARKDDPSSHLSQLLINQGQTENGAKRGAQRKPGLVLGEDGGGQRELCLGFPREEGKSFQQVRHNYAASLITSSKGTAPLLQDANELI